MSMTSGTDTRVADAVARNWVDTRAPVWTRPYLRLARADRPIGTWLLLIPCWWGTALAGAAPWDRPDLYILFAIGAWVMRGAGCTFNDIVDHESDAMVARTRSRPIPSGQVTVRQAWAFAILLCLVGFAVLVQFNWLTIGVGIASLALVAIYPFMKRVTWWPQVFLGLAFNWGALVGWTAVTGSLDWPAVVLYAGGIAWTLGYDTIYAHQDKADDEIIGVKSTARLFGAQTKRWLTRFFALTLVIVAAAALMAGAGVWLWPFLLAAGVHFAWQVATLEADDPGNCITRFRANRDAGLIILAGLVLA